MDAKQDDPKGLIHEAFQIEGITSAECRSIFLDWALSLPAGADVTGPIKALLSRYEVPGHPMTEVLRDGLGVSPTPRRRGGRAARVPE